MARSVFPRFLLFVLLAANGTAALGRDLRIIFTEYTPPYVLEDGTGIMVDLVGAALSGTGYTIEPVYVPIGRGIKLFGSGQVDGTTIIREGAVQKAEYSADFMQYHNRAFALKPRHLSIRSFADLADKTVIGFQNAHQYLGDAFGKAVAGNPRYAESARQEAQVRMLLLGRADVVVMDESIFLFYWRKFQPDAKGVGADDFVAYDLFPATPFKAAFTDPKVRDAFDRGIAKMRKDGRYDAIYRKYATQYLAVRQ